MPVEKGPDEKSGDYRCMAPYWELVDAINGGAEAMRNKGQRFLPKFPNEGAREYDYRRTTAPFTNIYSDVSKSLSSKPFVKETTLKEGASQSLLDICEDIDGQGNNLHVFAANIFQHGLDNAIDWILVDYTKAPAPPDRSRSIAEERSQGLRPYWVHIAAERIFAVYSDFVDGKELIVHARIYEPCCDRDGFDEKVTERIRVFDRAEIGDGTEGRREYAPATFEVYEKQKATVPGIVADKWISIEGPNPVDIGIIPLVPFMTGRRLGATWVVRPPLRDIAYLQVEEFQQESNLKSIMELTCFPMLSGEGVPDKDEKGAPIRVPVGPGAVLFAPPTGPNGEHGSWKFIEITAQSVNTVIKQLENTQKNMRDLGMQPLTTGNLTVITTANIAVKAHSAVQAWALALKDALELAFVYTNMWLGDATSDDPEVEVYTDFGAGTEDQGELDSLLTAQAQGVLSKQTTREEFKRRGKISENVDLSDEDQRIAEEQQGLQPEQVINPVSGQPVPLVPAINRPQPARTRLAATVQ